MSPFIIELDMLQLMFTNPQSQPRWDLDLQSWHLLTSAIRTVGWRQFAPQDGSGLIRI